YMTVYRPVKDTQGHVIGILYIGFDITNSLLQLQKAVNKLTLEESGYFLLMRKVDQMLIAHPQFTANEPVTESMLDGLSLTQVMQEDTDWRYSNSKKEP